MSLGFIPGIRSFKSSPGDSSVCFQEGDLGQNSLALSYRMYKTVRNAGVVVNESNKGWSKAGNISYLLLYDGFAFFFSLESLAPVNWFSFICVL